MYSILKLTWKLNEASGLRENDLKFILILNITSFHNYNHFYGPWTFPIIHSNTSAYWFFGLLERFIRNSSVGAFNSMANRKSNKSFMI